jgi:hypothetical protein
VPSPKVWGLRPKLGIDDSDWKAALSALSQRGLWMLEISTHIRWRHSRINCGEQPTLPRINGGASRIKGGSFEHKSLVQKEIDIPLYLPVCVYLYSIR